MSCSYAEGLSKYENKGKLGLPERFDPADEVERKVQILAQWMRESKHTVIHTGAGISTAAGIPDFRGPNGVWTLEKEGLKPDVNISWDDARPTLTHMAIVSLEQHGYVQYVVTQNIDGLHLRSGLQRKKLAELHGDMFVDKCNLCQRQFVRSSAATTVGQKSEGKSCPSRRSNGRRCRGKLHDNILDWEDGLPDADLDLAISHACVADLSLCLGTTLQIVPSGNIPVDTKKRGGRLVICNLQPTKQDRHADLIINTYVDDLMKRLLELLGVPLLTYSPDDDPLKVTQRLLQGSRVIGRSDEEEFEPIEWTIPEEWVKDKELADRVKARKVIRKRPGVKEEVIERKKVKNSLVSLDGKGKREDKGEENRDLCHRNGEVKEEEGEEEKDGIGSIKEELETKSNKEVTKREIKEENKIKPITKEEADVKMETQEVRKAENDNNAVKREEEIKEEKMEVGGKEEHNKIYSNGNAEGDKEGSEETDNKAESEEEKEEEEIIDNTTLSDRNDEKIGNEIGLKINEKEEEKKKGKKQNYDNGVVEQAQNDENGRTDSCSNGEIDDTGKGSMEGHISKVTEGRSLGEENGPNT